MQLPPSNPQSGYDFQFAFTPIIRHLERLDERTQGLATRADVESLRRELVAKEVLITELTALKASLMRIDADCAKGKAELEGKIKELKKEQLSRQELFALRVAGAAAALATILAVFDFVTRFHFVP